MNSVIARGVEIGTGRPKICVSITGRNRAEILHQINQISNMPFDMVEWRVDFFEELTDYIAVKEMVLDIDRLLINKPIIFTFRSSMEGGQKWIPAEQYSDLIHTAVGTGVVDIVDIELFMGDKFVENLISAVHRLGVKVLVSNHDFDKTPSRDKIFDRLKNMVYIGADIAKIAVMPKNKSDVLELLSATLEAEEKIDIPVVTMSMGKWGMISRISGEFFGSAITFGAGSSASAPGQIPSADLNKVLNILHTNLEVN